MSLPPIGIRDVLTKVTDTVGRTLSQDSSEPKVAKPSVQQQPSSSSQLPQLFGGGLLGRAIGGLVGSAIQQVI